MTGGQPPYRRYRDAWVRRVRSEPNLSPWTPVVLEQIVMDPEKRRGNRYVIRRALLADRLGVSEDTVKRSIRQGITDGWLDRCGGGHNGRPQAFHRSTSWDPWIYWGFRCPICDRGYGVTALESRGAVCTPTCPPTCTPTVRDSARSLVCVHSQRLPDDDLLDLLVESVIDRMLTDEVLAVAS